MKTKALISFAVTEKLICVFVFAYAKSRFSHDAAHTVKLELKRTFGRHLLDLSGGSNEYLHVQFMLGAKLRKKYQQNIILQPYTLQDIAYAC